jgi:hypothetical protein
MVRTPFVERERGAACGKQGGIERLDQPNASTRARKVSGHAGMVCAVCAVCAAAGCTSGKPAQRKARATVDRLRFFMAILSAAAMPRRKREKEKSAANNGALASCIA